MASLFRLHATGNRHGRFQAGVNMSAKDHMGRVAEMGCILCHRLGYGHTPAEVHHIREGQGMSQRASDFLTLGLCPEHHRGASGIHGLGRNAFERTYKLTELDLLADVIARLK